MLGISLTFIFMKTRFRKGFTLIELLIVIAIIGVLAVAFLPTLLGAPAKARDAQRVSSLQSIQSFLESQRLAGRGLPTSEDVDCILEDGVDEISTLIMDYRPEFGGVFPSDPDKDIGPGDCTGGFAYRYYGIDADYSAAAWARLETDDNANADCDEIAGWEGDDDALPEWVETNEAHDTPCYYVLVP